MVTEFVKMAIDFREIHIFIKVVLQIFHLAALLVRYTKRVFTSLRNTSSSIRLKPILSNGRSNIKSHP